MFRAKKVIASVLTVFLAVSLVSPAFADDEKTISQTITYSAKSEDPSQIPSTFENNEGTWSLSSVEVKSAPQMEHAKVSHTEFRQCLPEDLAATEASFASEMEVEKDGVKSTVKLSGVQAIPVTQDVEAACNQVVVFSGLPSNDMIQIPGTWTGFTEACPNEVTLELAGCSWAVSSVDEFGMPKTYDATALYRGLAVFEDLHHYDVTATYEWEGERAVAGGLFNYTAVATYTLDAEGVAVSPLWLPFALLGVAAVGGFGFAFAAYRRRNVTFYRGEEGRFEKVARGRAKRLASGNLALDFPAQFDLTKNPYKIELRRDIAGSAKIIVLQRGELVYEGRAKEVIDIAKAA